MSKSLLVLKLFYQYKTISIRKLAFTFRHGFCVVSFDLLSPCEGDHVCQCTCQLLTAPSQHILWDKHKNTVTTTDLLVLDL